MPVIRRWNVFVVLAVVFLILLYRPSLVSDWYRLRPYDPVAEPVRPIDHTVNLAHADEDVAGPVVNVPITTSTSPAAATSPTTTPTGSAVVVPPAPVTDDLIHYSKQPERYPVQSLLTLPTAQPARIPKIQDSFHTEDGAAGVIREERLRAVKKSFQRSWASYKTHAWLKDELKPISGGYRNAFGGWAATLVDTLDTLWMMGLQAEFDEAVAALDAIDFTATEDPSINVFETTIRYLGGLLAAHDLSQGRHALLLTKATEVGDMLYGAFDTPNRMPVTRWDWETYNKGDGQKAPAFALIAELGSLSLEFTRLSQLTGDLKYFDAVQRITNELDQAQNQTKLPGMWPVVANAQTLSFLGDGSFTLGGMADSLFEYLPKQYMLLGGLSPQSRKMYEVSIEVAKQRNFFRPMTEDGRRVLLSGDAKVLSDGEVKLVPRAQHLACFTGGMVAIGAKIFNRPADLQVAQELVEGCIWAYEIMPTGIMPEVFFPVPCADEDHCPWDQNQWYRAIGERYRTASDAPPMSDAEVEHLISKQGLVPGVVGYEARKYILRPEAIESLFILYRITGNTTLLDTAWKMFGAIERYTATELANAAIDDVTSANPSPEMSDRMESFWLAETLKYFYLIFSDPTLVSLDEYVLNTEAHPLKRPQPE
ncbi:MAG: hypothetical protein M1838_005522 [Thelocarpon superellum]|nr:MAG: hypothetical protein M1838_005522 [Thelocarpon superellum]